HVPGHKAALRAALTGIISKAPLGLALEHAGAALGAAPRHMLHDGLGVLALREARACQEAAKAAVLDDHLPAAQLADLLGLLLGHLEAGVLEGFLRLLHVLVEAGIEIGKHLLPGKLALLYLVELLLHMRGKGHINDILEALL